MNTTEQQLWLSSGGLSERWGVPLATVRKWRHEGTGPVGIKFGRHVRYALTEVERWEQAQAAKQMSASA